ncbi:MAG: PHP domain-containing protein [Chloroflexota bacterium]
MTNRFQVAESDLVDLHTHSVANDGRWRPATLAKAASMAGIRVVALTDHDTVAAVPAFAAEAASAGLYALPGVEVSSWWRGAIYHVLLYNVDLRNPRLVATLSSLWGEIKDVAARAVAQLHSHGYELPDLDSLRQGGDLLPIHVIVAAMQGGVAPDFMGVIGALREMGISLTAGVDMAEAVAAGHAAGGLAVLAHPGRTELGFTPAGPDAVAEMVAKTGLDGIEVYHWSHGPAEEATYGRLAAERGLLISCGSDSHGPRSKRPLRGREAALCRDLLERCGIEVVSSKRRDR